MKPEVERALLSRAEAHLASGTSDMSDRCLRVAAAHYVGVEQLRLEQQHWFRRRPLLVALTPDLPDPGCYLALEAGELPLLLTRGEDRRVRAFLNACRHRGTRIAAERGRQRRLVCPFHAWSYDLEGCVRSRPLSFDGFEGIGPSYERLRPVPCREVAGMIFVLLEGDAIDAELERLLGRVQDEIGEYRIAEHAYFATRVTERACNYKFIMDGFAESYHLKVLHHDTIAPYYSASSLFDALGPVGRIIGLRTSIESERDRHARERRLLRHATTQYLIPPNALLAHQVDHVQFWQIHPLGGDPGRCRVRLSLYWPLPLDEDAKRKAEFNLDVLWQVTTTQDFPQSQHIHANLAAGALEELVFGRNEPCLIHYHEQMARVAGSGGVSRI